MIKFINDYLKEDKDKKTLDVFKDKAYKNLSKPQWLHELIVQKSRHIDRYLKRHDLKPENIGFDSQNNIVKFVLSWEDELNIDVDSLAREVTDVMSDETDEDEEELSRSKGEKEGDKVVLELPINPV